MAVVWRIWEHHYLVVNVYQYLSKYWFTWTHRHRLCWKKNCLQNWLSDHWSEFQVTHFPILKIEYKKNLVVVSVVLLQILLSNCVKDHVFHCMPFGIRFHIVTKKNTDHRCVCVCVCARTRAHGCLVSYKHLVFICVKAVSYTHLDVYKRQVSKCL